MPNCLYCGAAIVDPTDDEAINHLKFKNGSTAGVLCYDHTLDEILDDIMIVDARIGKDERTESFTETL